jgi:hypothetical protein
MDSSQKITPIKRKIDTNIRITVYRSINKGIEETNGEGVRKNVQIQV